MTKLPRVERHGVDTWLIAPAEMVSTSSDGSVVVKMDPHQLAAAVSRLSAAQGGLVFRLLDDLSKASEFDRLMADHPR